MNNNNGRLKTISLIISIVVIIGGFVYSYATLSAQQEEIAAKVIMIELLKVDKEVLTVELKLIQVKLDVIEKRLDRIESKLDLIQVNKPL